MVLFTKPAFGDEALHVYVAPGLFVTLKFTTIEAQVGLGSAASPAGAAGASGSVKTIGPEYIPEEQPTEFVRLKLE